MFYSIKTGCSSQSSVVSCGSIKQRRNHPAQEHLTLQLPAPVTGATCDQEGVSPLYVEPWDRLDTCIHGSHVTGQVECHQCQHDLHQIITECDLYLNSDKN